MDFRASAWEVINKHLSDPASMVKHQIDSFESFMSTGIDQVIQSYSPIEVSEGPYDESGPSVWYSVTPSNVSVSRCVTHDKFGKPSVLVPNDARLRNLTYGSTLTLDLEVQSQHRSESGGTVTAKKRIEGVVIGSVPIMVGTRYCTLRDRRFRDYECPYDPTGYFIINGNEKALVSLDRIGENKTYVFAGAKSSMSECLVSEVRSVGVKTPGCPKTTSLVMNLKPSPYGNAIRASINSVRTDLPVALVFRALGVQTDREIVDWVAAVGEPLGLARADVEHDMHGSLVDGGVAFTEQDAILHILKYTSIGQSSTGSRWRTTAQQISAVRALLRDDLFPHAGDGDGKVSYLSYMIAKLLRVKRGISAMDDRDSYVNKRIDTPGALMSALFRQHYSKFVREMRSMLHKELQLGAWRTTGQLINLLSVNNLYKIVRPSIITAGMTYALATGNWGIKNSRSCKQGVAQVLNRMTFNATISHLRRVNTRIEKTGKLVQPRKLHTTHWGVVCLAETPEGSSIGLVKNLALTACITTHSSAVPVVNAVRKRTTPIDPAAPSKRTLVTVNGAILGQTGDPKALVSELRAGKRNGSLNPFVSVVWDITGGEVRVNTEAGRCCRPVLTVTDGIPDISCLTTEQVRTTSLPELLMGCRRVDRDMTPGVVEYLDIDETDHSLIAMRPEELKEDKPWTHVELDPAVALGVVAATIPFSHHNQSPRNTYQCAMAKQAIGLYSTSFRARHDTLAHVLDYPQKPIVNTRMASHLNVDELPSGVNAVVAIATHTGFNQEDSLIFNQASVDRGLFSSTFYRTYKEHNSRNHSTGEEEHYYNPLGGGNTPATLKAFNYDKLEECGFVPENTFVDSKDIIIGKCMPHKHNGVIVTRDCSVPVKSNECGYVDANCFNDNRFPTSTSDGYSFCKVRLRSTRKPVIGDKLAARSGQKGTIGVIRRECDMPVTADGIVPDIIMNPHAIPSRMTVGQLMECVMGKGCCFTGEYGDATPFTDVDIDKIGEALEEVGMERYANEVVVSGTTGELMIADLFIGPTYYQRLKHMTTDKCHSRSANGPVTALVRQPAEGRARDGGLRLGEMEMGCLFCHGTMHFLKERVFDCSDGFRVFSCKQCGRLSNVNPEKDIHECKMCGNATSFSELRMPYAFKLLSQECEAMGIGMRFNAHQRIS
jgi:DNA-directed RNA polymerase II subunit RPB2